MILILFILLLVLILTTVLTVVNVAILWHYKSAQPMLNVHLFIYYAKCIHGQFHSCIRSMDCEITETYRQFTLLLNTQVKFQDGVFSQGSHKWFNGSELIKSCYLLRLSRNFLHVMDPEILLPFTRHSKQYYLHCSSCVLRKVNTSSDVLIKERQTTDGLLLAAEFQGVTV